jgi:dihydropyrimidinase
MKKTIIKNGIIVTSAEEIHAELLIVDGKISKIEESIEDNDAEIIDAKGNYIIPGGIDPHVHFALNTPAGLTADDFESGGKAALAGGTTTIIDFVTPTANEDILEAFDLRMKEAISCPSDFSLHMSITKNCKWSEKSVQKCIDEYGVPSFKVYTAYQDSIGIENNTIEKVMQSVSPKGGIVLIHCEDENIISTARNALIHNQNLKPCYHPTSRPIKAEVKAIKDAIELGFKNKASLYIVHVSSYDGSQLISQAKRDGLKIFSETCPQYFYHTSKAYDTYQAIEFIMSPPLRSMKSKEGIQRAVLKGDFDVIATDHCSFTKSQKQNNNFTKIPNGAAGVENRLALMYTEFVQNSGMSMSQLVQLSATNAANIFGLSHCKGDIKEGLDADLVIFNTAKQETINPSTHHYKTDSNIYEGIVVNGISEKVFLRGELVFENGKHTPLKPGNFVKRKSFK